MDNPLVRSLESGGDNGYLQSIERDWRRAGFSTKRYCAYETLPWRGTKIIVDRFSGTRLCDEEPVAIPADHESIVKPSGKDDDAYIALKNAVASNTGFPHLVASGQQKVREHSKRDDVSPSRQQADASAMLSGDINQGPCSGTQAGGKDNRMTINCFPSPPPNATCNKHLGTGTDPYENVCDTTIVQFGLEMAKTLDSMADDLYRRLLEINSTPQARGSGMADAERMFFSTHYHDCCMADVPQLRDHLIRIAGPASRDVDKDFAITVTEFDWNSHQMVGYSQVREIAKYLRTLSTAAHEKLMP